MAGVPFSKCPSCGYAMDQATAPYDEHAVPQPGNLSVCLNCAAVLTFTDDLHVRLSTLAERSGAGPELEQYVGMIAARGRLQRLR